MIIDSFLEINNTKQGICKRQFFIYIFYVSVIYFLSGYNVLFVDES